MLGNNFDKQFDLYMSDNTGEEIKRALAHLIFTLIELVALNKCFEEDYVKHFDKIKRLASSYMILNEFKEKIEIEYLDE